MRGKSKRVWSALGSALAIGAIAAPGAFAVPAEDYLGSSGAKAVEQPYSSVNSITPPTPTSSAPSSSGTATADRFDWGDAGLGAASMLALTAIAGGVALVTVRPRNRHTAA